MPALLHVDGHRLDLAVLPDRAGHLTVAFCPTSRGSACGPVADPVNRGGDRRRLHLEVPAHGAGHLVVAALFLPADGLHVREVADVAARADDRERLELSILPDRAGDLPVAVRVQPALNVLQVDGVAAEPSRSSIFERRSTSARSACCIARVSSSVNPWVDATVVTSPAAALLGVAGQSSVSASVGGPSSFLVLCNVMGQPPSGVDGSTTAAPAAPVCADRAERS